MTRYPFLLALLVPLTGCLTDIGRCTYETRTLEFEAVLSGTVQGKPDSGLATLLLGEAKGSFQDRSLAVTVQTFLAGAIAEAKVLNTSSGADEVLASLSGNGGQEGWYGYLQLTSPQPSGRLLKLLEEFKALDILVTIGTGTGGALRGKLKLVSDDGWEQPYCS